MTTYAPVPAYANRSRHPRALLAIVLVHAALLAVVMSVRMDLPVRWDPTVTKVKLIPLPPEPPQNQPRPNEPKPSEIDRVLTAVPIPPLPAPPLDSIPLPLPLPGPGPVAGSGPIAETLPPPAPVRAGPRFITPEWDIKPPYPQQKIRLEEEAILRLRLAINERGRVTSVESVGPADPIFLAAARRHLMARWRYKPATEDGRAVATSTVITLQFQLED